MPTNRERLWRAMRQLRRFDMRQLRTATSTDYQVAYSFVSGLCRTGYVVKRNGSYVLARDTGPKPPRLRNGPKPGSELLGAVDRNTGEIYGVDGGAPPGPTQRQRIRALPQPKPRRQWHPRWRRSDGDAR